MTHTDVVSHRPRLALSLLLACALLALTATAAHAAVTARGSVEQVQVTGAKHGGKLKPARTATARSLQTARRTRSAGSSSATSSRARATGCAQGGGATSRRDGALRQLGAAQHGDLQPGDPDRRATAT